LSQIAIVGKEELYIPMPDCVAPEEIREETLLAFVEGEPSPAVRDHVARCSACAEEVAALQQVDRLFAAAYDRATCLERECQLCSQVGLLTSGENKRGKWQVKDCRDWQAVQLELPSYLFMAALSSWPVLKSGRFGRIDFLEQVIMHLKGMFV
jgi:hypothetical protein